ncbi:MAG: hypothetical protein RI904_2346, partial [Pseudomonadota bacterium]
MARRKTAISFDQVTGTLSVVVSGKVIANHGRVATLVRSKDGALKVLFADGTQAVYEGFTDLPAGTPVIITFSGNTYRLTVGEILDAAEHAPHLTIGDLLIVSGDQDDVAAYIGDHAALREGCFLLSEQNQGQTNLLQWSVFDAPAACGSGFEIFGAAAVLGIGFAALVGKGTARDTTPTEVPVELLVIPLAGPFTGNVTVRVYDQFGGSLGLAIQQSDGSYKITVNGYTGNILVVVSDNDTDAEYIDEATGALKDMGANILRVMDYMPPGNHTVSVTPLTELAARVAGVGPSNAVSNDQLIYNQKVGQLFGVEAITSVAKTILDISYNENDGINDAEHYGRVLAALSGVDALTGGMGATIQRLQDAIVVSSDGELNLHHRAVELLDQGTKIVENGPNYTASALSAVNVQAALFVEISGGAKDGQIVPGGLIQPTSDTYQHVNVAIELLAAVQSGDEVTVTWTWADGHEISRTHSVTYAEKSAGLAKVTFDANGLPGQASSFDISRTGVDVKVTARVSQDGAVVQSNVPLLIDIYLAQDYIPSVPKILSLDADVGAIVQVLDGGYCVDVTPTLRGRASAGSLVNIYDNGVMISSVNADGNGQWTY